MLNAVEVQRESHDSSETVLDDIDNLARTHGYPKQLSDIVVNKFDDITTAYMNDHFKTAIPVSVLIKVNYCNTFAGVQQSTLV